MPSRNVPLLCQIAGHSVALVLSTCVVAAMSLYLEEFNGKCVLFSEGDWYGKKLSVSWASETYCHYVLCVAVLVEVACLVQIARLLLLWLDGGSSSFLACALEAGRCAVMIVMTFSAAVITSAGFFTWCQSVADMFPSCKDTAGEAIQEVVGPTDWFYLEIEICQVCVWATFSTLVGLCVSAVVRVLLRHQRLNLVSVVPYVPNVSEGVPRSTVNVHRAQDGTAPATVPLAVTTLTHWLLCRRDTRRLGRPRPRAPRDTDAIVA